MDLISSLPDDLLQHIIYFLETRCAVKTSILSKRWRYQWAYTPAFDFENEHDDQFMTEKKIGRALSNHKCLSLRRLRISVEFHLRDTYRSRSSGLELEFLDELLKAILPTRMSKVEELDLRCRLESWRIDGFYTLPGNIFSNENLRILRLDSCEIDIDASGIKLAGVEALSLIRVKGPVKTIERLISSCYNVKDLNLCRCPYTTIGPRFRRFNVDLSLEKLRKMTLYKCKRLKYFTIDAPKLQQVTLADQDLVFAMPNSLDLKHAELRLEFNNSQIIDLVRKLGIAESLKLSIARYDVQLRLDFSDNCPPCCNVKKLLMTENITSALSILKLFPNLEDFTIACHKDDVCSFIKKSDDGTITKDEDDDLRDVSIYCLQHSLKRIKIKNFRGYRHLKVVKFLVENSMVLEIMNLTNCYGDYLHLSELKNDLIASRASPTAQIIYTRDSLDMPSGYYIGKYMWL